MTATAAPDEQLAYRPREAARLLGVDERTVRRLIASGRLRCIRPSARLTLIPRAALYDLLDTAQPADQEAAR